jgi:transcriptional regulator with XRE-family HTH domain
MSVTPPTKENPDKDRPGQRIAAARKARSWTQEELADRTKLTVRTIQRVENNETVPRLHTLRAIAATLEIPFETIYASPEEASESRSVMPADRHADERDFLRLVNLSSFSYLLLPFVHFLVPAFLLRKRPLADATNRQIGRRIVRTQAGWVAATNALMLLTLFYNLLQASYAAHPVFISYLAPFAMMYILNGLLILRQGKRITAV